VYSREPPSDGPERAGILSPAGGIEQWIRRNDALVALGVVAGGIAIRIASIRGFYLAADEGTHFELVNVPLADVYRSTLTEAHPPLFFLVFHFWRLAGTSEFFLRLLPVLFGVLFLVAAHQWARHLFGKSEGLFTLVILTFSPALVSLSTEVRGYSLLLLLMAAALLVLERAIEKRSARGVALFSVLLYLVILTHYAALWFTAAVFVYVLVCVRRDRLPASFLWTWLGLQLGAATLYVLFYFTHFVKLRGGELERHAMTRWLRPEYFHADQENVLQYLSRQTAGLFRALLGSSVVAHVGLVLAVSGVVLLLYRKRPAGLLLALPFLVGAAVGLTAIYPFGGTRHSGHLFLFACAAIGVAATAVVRGRHWPALLMILVLGPVSCSMTPAAPNRSITHMTAAMTALHGAAPPGSILFADTNTGTVLSYYLGRDRFNREGASRARFRENLSGQYRLVRAPVWSFNQKTFTSEFLRFLEVYRPAPGQVIWLVRLGSEYEPRSALSRKHLPVALRSEFRRGEIAVVEVALP
jgi:hypothetical protein